MRIEFENLFDIYDVQQFNVGVEPRYGRKGSTMRGVVWCHCGACVADISLLKECKVVGWLDTKCSVCGSQINYSDADLYL
jgi:hypothetical protein